LQDVSSLVRSPQSHEDPHEDIQALRARVAGLEATFAERDAELSRTQAELAAFRIRYRQRVGRLHEELDELERAINEAELGILSERVKEQDPADVKGAPREVTPRSLSSDTVRRLFRDVAKTIHPDLADDDDERERRHKLMIEANRAYAQGDEERLRWILEAWENSPEAVTGSDLDAMRLRLMRRIAQIEEQLTVLASDLADMKASSLWQLKAMVDAETANGNDLMADMIRRLNRDILVARNRLDALQPRG
jgi:hypothetical protein